MKEWEIVFNSSRPEYLEKIEVKRVIVKLFFNYF